MELFTNFTQTYSLKWAILGNQNTFSELLHLQSKKKRSNILIVPSQTSTAFTCFLVTLYFKVQFLPFIYYQPEFRKCWDVF